jgi:hypothetical protein
MTSKISIMICSKEFASVKKQKKQAGKKKKKKKKKKTTKFQPCVFCLIRACDFGYYVPRPNEEALCFPLLCK